MAVDGRGFHKAKMPTQGNRLILLVSMASSLFGQDYGRTQLQVKDSALSEAVKRDAKLCSAYDLSYELSEATKKVLTATR